MNIIAKNIINVKSGLDFISNICYNVPMNKYYNGDKLCAMKDINGRQPEIIICTSNRTAGKTTYFGKKLVDSFLAGNGKFILLYRYNYELEDCANKFFKDLSGLFYNGARMSDKKQQNAGYANLYLGENHCGYAISINSADNIKKFSHVFSDATAMLFDEFQSENSRYCKNEIAKFISIHTSVARGQGEQVRFVPVYMLSNPVSLLNPYYTALGISTRLRKETKFLRGDGYVLEQAYNETASQAQRNSAFQNAFMENKYAAYSSQGIYLHDDRTFIAKPSGRGRYLCTLRYEEKDYSVIEYADEGYIYCGTNPDRSFPIRVAVTTADHNVNFVMLKQNIFLVNLLRYYFERGAFRFKNLNAKEAILKTISY